MFLQEDISLLLPRISTTYVKHLSLSAICPGALRASHNLFLQGKQKRHRKDQLTANDETIFCPDLIVPLFALFPIKAVMLCTNHLFH